FPSTLRVSCICVFRQSLVGPRRLNAELSTQAVGKEHVMASWLGRGWDRRQFLGTAVGLVGAKAGWSWAGDRPRVTAPRATSGDNVEPDWKQRLTITVGPRDADLIGSSDKVLQAAVDYVTRLGGGTVRILPGTYHLRNAVYLQPHVRLLGSGADSVLVKEPS